MIGYYPFEQLEAALHDLPALTLASSQAQLLAVSSRMADPSTVNLEWTTPTGLLLYADAKGLQCALVGPHAIQEFLCDLLQEQSQTAGHSSR